GGHHRHRQGRPLLGRGGRALAAWHRGAVGPIRKGQVEGRPLPRGTAHGYLDAGFTRGDLIVEPATHTARAYITLETGERYRFGPTTIEQSALRAGLVRRYLRYKEGDWYDAESLLRTQFALDDSQYFSVVEVLPEERDRKNKVAAVRITSE